MNILRTTMLVAAAVVAVPSLAQAGDVTPDVIFGSGNANGSWTIDRSNGVELGLRGKLRHNSVGAPENTFNWDGVDTYTFAPGVAPTQSFPTAVWSFEWAINSNWDGTSGYDLDDLTYELSMTSTNGASMPGFDPINGVNPGNGQVFWDHAIGTNATGNGGGTSAVSAVDYGNLIDANNVAQQSWKPHWFVAGFDPTRPGDYNFSLKAFDGQGALVAQTDMTVTAVPLPPAALLGLGLLGGVGLIGRMRRRSRK